MENRSVDWWSNLGRAPYRETWDLQERRRSAILAGELPGHLYVVEHPPTVTLGRGEKGDNLLVTASQLHSRGFDVEETSRRGKITYHGPGQLVAYPVFNIKTLGRGVKDFVHGLEETMIRTLAEYGLKAVTRSEAIGAWVDGRKIGSIGIHVRKQVSIHGLALNVSTDLSHFNVMNPCGLSGVSMTSLKNEGVDVELEEVVPVFVQIFQTVFGKGTHAFV